MDLKVLLPRPSTQRGGYLTGFYEIEFGIGFVEVLNGKFIQTLDKSYLASLPIPSRLNKRQCGGGRSQTVQIWPGKLARCRRARNLMMTSFSLAI